MNYKNALDALYDIVQTSMNTMRINKHLRKNIVERTLCLLKKEQAKATVHLVDYELDSNGDCPWDIHHLYEKYPTLERTLRRGDILEHIRESGYRSQGVVFFDGKKIITQDSDYDDYGHPPYEFKVITEFPIGYWDNGDYSDPEAGGKLPYIDWTGTGAVSRFYWHGSEFVPVAIDVEKLKLLDRPVQLEYHYYYVSGVYNCEPWRIEIGSAVNRDMFVNTFDRKTFDSSHVFMYDRGDRITFLI